VRILITGGVGFIGCNLADACIPAEHQLTLYDNLSRLGSEANLRWLCASHGSDAFTIYGNGKQVRDLLHVDDLVRTFGLATDRIVSTAGQAYNLGGGPENTLSVWAEFSPQRSEILSRPVAPAAYQGWRSGDQPVFVADAGKAAPEFGWTPRISVRGGIERLAWWVQANRELLA